MGFKSDGNFILYLALLHVWYSHSLTVTNIPHGVLTRPTDIVIRQQEWTVILTIQTPTRNLNSLRRGLKVRQVSCHGNDTSYICDTLNGLMARLDRLDKMPHSKRGLFDFIGLGAKYAFGLATESEIVDLKRKIAITHQEVSNIKVFADSLVAVVKTTHHEIKENRDLLNKLVNHSLESTQMTHLLMAASTQLDCYERVADEQRRIVHDLERGRLSRALFPPSMFEQLPLPSGTKWLDLHWYYHWVRVLPIWGEQTQFAVTLPIVRGTPTLGWELVSFPWRGPHQSIVKIDVRPFAITDLEKAVVSFPNRCLGKFPHVCDPGIILGQGCTRAILLILPLTDDCHMTLLDKAEFSYPLGSGEVIIPVFEPLVITETCPNQSIKTHALETGTYHVKWRDECTLSHPRFRATAINHDRRALNWTIPPINGKFKQYFEAYPSELPPLIPFNLKALKPVKEEVWWTTHTLDLGQVCWLSLLTILQTIMLIAWLKTIIKCPTKPRKVVEPTFVITQPGPEVTHTGYTPTVIQAATELPTVTEPPVTFASAPEPVYKFKGAGEP